MEIYVCLTIFEIISKEIEFKMIILDFGVSKGNVWNTWNRVRIVSRFSKGKGDDIRSGRKGRKIGNTFETGSFFARGEMNEHSSRSGGGPLSNFHPLSPFQSSYPRVPVNGTGHKQNSSPDRGLKRASVHRCTREGRQKGPPPFSSSDRGNEEGNVGRGIRRWIEAGQTCDTIPLSGMM